MQWCLRLLLEPFSIVIVTLGETSVGDLVYLHKVVSYLVIQQCDTIRIRYVSSSYFQGNSIHTYIHTWPCTLNTYLTCHTSSALISHFLEIILTFYLSNY